MSETRELCFYFKYLCFLLRFTTTNDAIKTKIREEPDIFIFIYFLQMITKLFITSLLIPTI